MYISGYAYTCIEDMSCIHVGDDSGKNFKDQTRGKIFPNGSGITRLMRSISGTTMETLRNFEIKGNSELAIHVQVQTITSS